MFWGDGSPSPDPPEPDYVPSFVAREPEHWRWRYSWLLGVMYGPIPVGLFAVIILYLLVVTSH